MTYSQLSHNAREIVARFTLATTQEVQAGLGGGDHDAHERAGGGPRGGDPALRVARAVRVLPRGLLAVHGFPAPFLAFRGIRRLAQCPVLDRGSTAVTLLIIPIKARPQSTSPLR